MMRSTHVLLGLCLTSLLASCGAAETNEDKAEQIQRDASYAGDIKSGTQLADKDMFDLPRSIGLAGGKDPSHLTLFRDVVTHDATTGDKTRCLSAIPDTLEVAKVFCDGDKTKAVATITAGQLPKFCVMLGEATAAVTPLALPCADAKVAPLATVPALFLGLR